MLAAIDFILMRYLAEIDSVAEKPVEGNSLEWNASLRSAGTGYPGLGSDVLCGEIITQSPNASQLHIPPENHSNGLGLCFVDDQLAILDVIAKRHTSAHPHSLLLGSGNLILNPFTDDLALELCEG